MSEIAHVFKDGDAVVIRADATKPNGDPMPQAGKRGTIIESPKPGRHLVDVPGMPLVNLLAEQLEAPPPAGSAKVITDVVAKGDAPNAPVPLTAQETTYGFDVLERDATVASLTNPRTYFDPAALQDLADSIAAMGLAQPILVRPLPEARRAEFAAKGKRVPTHEVVAGERRWRACGIAKVRSFPVLIRQLTDEQVLELQLEENMQRKDLHPLEEAHGYRRILDLPQHAAQSVRERVEALSARIKKSTRYIYQTMQLLKLCSFAQEIFLEGKLQRTTALQIATIGNEAGQIEATRAIAGLDAKGKNVVDAAMSQREAEEYVRENFRLVLNKAPFPIKVEYAGIAACTGCPKMSANVPGLIAEGEKMPDTCMDSACYGKKNEAHKAQFVKAAAAQGQKVIAGAAAKKFTSEYSSSGLANGNDYLTTDATLWDGQCNGKTIKALLGKDAPAPTLIERHDGTGFIEALPRKQINELLKKKGLLTKARTSGGNDDQRKREAKAKAEKAWRAEVAVRLLEAVPKQPNQDALRSQLLLPMSVQLYRALDHDATKRVDKLLGWDLGKWPSESKITAHFKSIDGTELNRFVVAALIAGELHVNTYASNYQTEDIDRMASLLKVDKSAVKTKLAAEAKAAEKKKAAPPTKKVPAKKTPSDKPSAPKAKGTDADPGEAAIVDALKAVQWMRGAKPENEKSRGEVLQDLLKAGITSGDDLADMTVDELTKATCLVEGDARAVIMKAREKWFAGNKPAGATTPAKAEAKPKAKAKGRKLKPSDQLALDIPAPATKLKPQPAWPFPTAKKPEDVATEGAAA
jgi:ParB/RepB/Spo0J family partition protein